MAEDKETSTRAQQIQKEREARIEKLIRTLEAGQDKDADRFRKVDKLDKERVKLAKKEEKFEDLGKKLFQSTMGGMFGGLGKSIPEPVKIMGRMVGVMFGARGRIKRKKAKLLKKVYKRAAEVGMDTSSFAEKSPEALEEIEKNIDTIESIKLPEEPDPKKESSRYDPIGFLLGKGPSGEVPGAAPDEPAELGKGAFASGVGGLSEAANKAIIDLSDAALSKGSIFVHDYTALEFLKKSMDTPAQKKEKEMEETAEKKRTKKRWEKLFDLLGGRAAADPGAGESGFLGGLMGGLGAKILPWIMGLFALWAFKIARAGGFVLTGLKAAGPFLLVAAMIGWGIYGVVKVIQDFMAGFKEGDLAGGIGQALGGAGEGIMNAFKQSIKWGGIGALIGMIVGSVVPGFGTIVGGLVGGMIGMALGALFGYIGGDRITKGLNKAGEAVKRGWNAMMKWLGDTTKAIGNWFYTPKSTHPDHPDPAFVMGVALEWPEWMVKAGQKLKAGWDALTTWFSNTIEKIGAWLYTPGQDTGPGGMGAGTGPKIFGIQLPPLPSPGDLIDKAWKALTGWVTSIGKWFWDDEGKMFGGRFDPNFKITLPEFSIPDFDALMKSITDKFTGGVAEVLSSVPKVLLPKGVEEWIDANRDPTKAAEAAKLEAEQSVASGQARLKEIESEKAAIREKGGTITAQQKDAMQAFKDSGYKRLPSGLSPEQQKIAEEINMLAVKGKAIPEELLAKLNTDTITAEATEAIAKLDQEAATVRGNIMLDQRKIVSATTKIANLLSSGDDTGGVEPTTSTGGVNKSVGPSDRISGPHGSQKYTPSAGGGVTQSGTKKVSGQGNITRLKVGDEHLSKENLARKGTDEFDSQAGVAAAYAPQFQGFVQDLLATGYKINYFGGYRKSDVAGSDKASWHQSGMAIDINKDTNPMYNPQSRKVGPDTPGAKPLGRDGRWIITDMPDNIYEIAQKWGLGWGGKWLNTVDAMHFSVAKKEGGTVASEDVTRGMVPILAAAQGLVGFVKKPTLILAGEKGRESVNIRPSTLTQQSSGLMPASSAGGGTTIINAPDNSTAIATSTNNQLNQEPGWAVFHTPVYQRGRYAA